MLVKIFEASKRLISSDAKILLQKISSRFFGLLWSFQLSKHNLYMAMIRQYFLLINSLPSVKPNLFMSTV